MELFWQWTAHLADMRDSAHHQSIVIIIFNHRQSSVVADVCSLLHLELLPTLFQKNIHVFGNEIWWVTTTDCPNLRILLIFEVLFDHPQTYRPLFIAGIVNGQCRRIAHTITQPLPNYHLSVELMSNL